MPKKYAAFLSYSSRYAAWVEVLQRNLEQCLRAAGEDRPVFLDRLDLGVGRSWVSGLQAGLDEADQLVLVVTPEALASPRVEDEWGSFIARHRDWKGYLQVAVLVETPLPPFLTQIQSVDFQDHDDQQYRRVLQQLVGGLLGRRDQRTPVALPDGVETPAAPVGLVPTAIRRALVAWLEEKLQLKAFRPAIAGCLGVHPTALEGYPSLGCAASAAVVQSTGEDDPPTAALRILRALKDTFEEQAGPLIKLEEELQQLLGSGPERGLLGVWRQCLARQHAELLPAFFEQGGEHAPLERVYVQLELRPEVRRQAQETEPTLVQPLALGELLALERADHPWITGRWVVLGDPGAGKTTLLRHLAWRLAREQEPRWTPMFDSLPRLVREREWLLDRMEWQLSQAGQRAKGLAKVLDRAGQEGRLLLLLDGLDEVSPEHRERLELLLRELSARWPESPLVVSSRPIGYRRPAGEFREVELLALGEEQQRELLARWFGRRDGSLDTARAETALARLAEPSLRELAGNPFYLMLMVLLIEEGEEPERNWPRLYDQVFKLLLAGRHRPGCEAIAAHAAVRAALRYLANAMTVDNRESEPVEEIEARLYQPAADAVREPLERVPSWRRSLRPFLDDVAERTSILGPHDGPGGDWRFLHRTFREALVAESLEGTYRSEGSAALLRQVRSDVGDKSRWAEPFALLTGRLEEPDDLVRALVAEDRTLGLRAIATAQNLRDETVREVLELSEKWRERAEVYQRIPELVDDPSRALALLDQLRLQTTNGNDLFFLGQAVAAVGERWPDARRSVSQLQANLFDHIPPPPDDLFRRIDKPLYGRVELWRNIPAGSFRMGSPPKEKERFDNEGPQHLVTVTSSFLLAAVPITHGQYLAFDPSHRSYFEDQVPAEELQHHPVDSVTWYEAMAFCGWLSRRFPGVRLPTEEEWEYACRAGTATPYWSGAKESGLARVGWYDKNSGGRTHRVGEKPANPWGLYDIHGNVWEWTLSERTQDYSQRHSKVTIDPRKADIARASGAERVMRGGGCWGGAHRARAACRGFGGPGDELRSRGFRILLPCRPEP